jgi:hypothetical protein
MQFDTMGKLAHGSQNINEIDALMLARMVIG